MKTKRIVPLLLALVLFLAGCGQQAPASGAHSGKLPEPPSAASAAPDTPQDFSAWGGGRSTLEDFYAYAAARHPEALAGVAYVGHLPGTGEKDLVWYDMTTDGFWSFMMEDISPDAWQMSCTGGPILVWCMAPSSPEIALTVYEQTAQEPGIVTPGEVLYRANPGEPVLFLVDRDSTAVPFCAEAEAPDGSTALLVPCADWSTERFQPALPGDGTAFDLTLRRGAGPLLDWQLCDAMWCQSSTVPDPEAGWLSLTSALFFGHDGSLYLEITHTDDGESVGTYEGSWTRTGPETFVLDLQLTGGSSIQAPDGAEQDRISAKCVILGGLDNTLLFREETEAEPRFTCLYLGGGSAMAAAQNYEKINLNPQVHLLKHALLDFLNDQAPQSASFAQLRRTDPEGWLFETYSIEGTVPQPHRWFRIDPGTCEGTALADGSPVDLNPFVRDLYDTMDLLDSVLYCYNHTREEYQVPADFAEITDAHSSLAQIALYSSGPTGSVYQTTWAVDSLTGDAWDTCEEDPVRYNIFEGTDQELPQVDTDRIIELAMNLYEETAGYRPGSAMVEPDDSGMVTVRLFDDMEDHIATAALYTIDPVTLTGYDAITGDPIDLFSVPLG